MQSGSFNVYYLQIMTNVKTNCEMAKLKLKYLQEVLITSNIDVKY